ncbi:MAG: UDP-N-acetylglucosamine 2-epimerase (non-hydrolyzing) [Alphaproteobacteria bacterium]
MTKEIKILRNSDLRPEVGVVVGTRPGIVMFAPIIHELRRRGLRHFIIHTGQHYSPNMDRQFFEDLNLPEPDHRLEGVADRRTHGGQTAVMLDGIEQVLLERRPMILLVGGDANTNLAGALAARKLRIAVGHVEAGERSYDWRMPEEHNRVLIDHVSDYLFVTGAQGQKNLGREGVRGHICVVGNPIVDASHQHLKVAREKSTMLDRLGVTPGAYGILTMHREENVDSPENLKGGLEGVSRASAENGMQTLFLAHPRTLKRLGEFDLLEWARGLPGLSLHEAVGYLDFLNILGHARMAFTDSGGVQQEACIHGVPCVTLRENTEWTETIDVGANRLVGCDPERIAAGVEAALTGPRGWEVPFGDGRAAAHIADWVEKHLRGDSVGVEMLD